MLGGVICGYCAIGSVQTATPPVSTMMMDTTVAKIGRSMKKRENKVRPPHRESGFAGQESGSLGSWFLGGPLIASAGPLVLAS